MFRLIPTRSSIVMLGADVGSGKSTVWCALAALLSKLGKVVFFVGEGSAEKDIKPMLRAASANMSNVVVIDCVTDEERAAWSLKEIAAYIRNAHPDVMFVFIDPLAGFENPDCKMRTVRRYLAPYQRMVENGVTVFIAHHTTKTRKTSMPIDMLSGSKGWPAAVQVVWQIMATDSEGHCILQMTRGRHFPKPWPCYEFWVDPSEVDPSIPVAVIGEESALRIEDLLDQKRPSQLPPALAHAVAWFHAYLSQGPRDALPDTDATYRRIGIARATFKKAKRIAKVLSRPKSEGRGYEWYLEESKSQSQQGCNQAKTSESPKAASGVGGSSL